MGTDARASAVDRHREQLHRGPRFASRRIEQLPRPRDVRDTLAAGEQAVVADAMEATRQNVDQEAADELVDGERHELLSFATFSAIILPLEGDTVSVAADQSAVGDGNAVGVAR